MNDSKVRAIISISVVITFMVVTSFISCYVFVNGLTNVSGNPVEKTVNALKDYASVFSGIIGIIIGFYFGRSQNHLNGDSNGNGNSH